MCVSLIFINTSYAFIVLSIDKGTKLMSPLMVAIRSGSGNNVERLLSRGASLNCPDQTKLTPLMVAARYGEVGIMKQLHQAGANVHYRSDTTHTAAMHCAAKADQAKAVEWLLKQVRVSSAAEPLSHD